MVYLLRRDTPVRQMIDYSGFETLSRLGYLAIFRQSHTRREKISLPND